MGQGWTLSHGARRFGAVACAALALISLAWIIRDLGEADESSDLWWTWAGLPYRSWDGVFGSSLLDLVLLLLAAFAGVAALRSPAAAGALGSLGAITLVLRLPLLWTVDADWLDDAPIADGLRTRATLSGWAGVLLGLALLVTVVVGRRPAAPADAGYGVPPTDRPPTVPGRAAAGVGGFFLAAVGCTIAAWQIYWAQELEGDTYERLFTGDHVFSTLLTAPPSWSAWAAVLLTLGAAGAAVARTASARPLGMMAGALVLVDGVADTSVYFKAEFIEHFDELPTRETLSVLSSFFEVLAGFLALVALSQRGVRPAGPWPGGGPGSPGPAGWYGHGTSPGGYGAPAGTGGYAGARDGYGGAPAGPGGYGSGAPAGYRTGPGAPGGYDGGDGPGAPGGYGYGSGAPDGGRGAVPPPPAGPPPGPPAQPVIPPPPASPPPPGPPPGW